MATAEIPGEGPSATMKPLQALIAIPVVVVVVIGFVALSSALGSAETYVGYLFSLYWAGLQRGDFKALPAAIGGAVFGLSLAFAMRLLTSDLGVTNGTLIFAAIVLPAVFCQMAGLFPTVINNMTMLMLIVGTMSYVQAHADFKGMYITLAVAIAYFSGLLWLVGNATALAEARRPRVGAPALRVEQQL